jgi:hypothetical protein
MMRSRIAASLIGLGMLLVASLGSVEAAETLEKTFYTVSTTLWFKVNDTPLRKLLPEGWEPVQIAGMQGSNLVITFTDVLASETPDGKLGETFRLASLYAPGQKSGTDEKATMVLGGLASDGSFVPGPYGNYVLAKARVDRHRKIETADESSCEEAWWFVGDNGATIEFRLKFAGGPVQHLKPPESKSLSAAKPDSRRITKTEFVSQPVRFGDIDTVKDVVFTASGPQLSPLFDGSQQLIGIFSIPWSLTQVLAP